MRSVYFVFHFGGERVLLRNRPLQPDKLSGHFAPLLHVGLLLALRRRPRLRELRCQVSRARPFLCDQAARRCARGHGVVRAGALATALDKRRLRRQLRVPGSRPRRASRSGTPAPPQAWAGCRPGAP